jgi:hypothetical protein
MLRWPARRLPRRDRLTVEIVRLETDLNAQVYQLFEKKGVHSEIQ